MNKSLVLFICLFVLGHFSVAAEGRLKEVRIGFLVSSDTIDLSLLDNAAHIEEIMTLFEKVENSNTLELKRVTFTGYASPESSVAYNRHLVASRRTALKKYILSHIDIPGSLIIENAGGIEWGRLTAMVEVSDMPNKDKTLKVLRDVPEPAAPVAVVESTAWTAETVSESEPTPISKPFYMSAKTNMLFDILALPNIGVEFYLGKNWTVTADWMYGWWSKNSSHHYWRAYGGGIAVRKWFGKAADSKPLTGHHLGVYGQMLIYNFEFGGKGQMAGEPGKPIWNNPSYAFGVDYGYSLPISRRLNIDFTIGIGYLGGKYYEYIPIDYHYVWQATKQRHWFGPTKAEVSLVWLLGNDNNNDKK